MSVKTLRRGGFLIATVVTSLCVAALPASAAPGDGSAYGVNVDVDLLAQPAVSVGPLAPSNTDGPTSGTVASVNVPGILTTGVITTTSVRDDDSGEVDAVAETANVNVGDLLGPLSPISIGAIRAECHATTGGVTGSTTLANANLGSLGTVNASPSPNTVINVSLPLVGNVASLTFNEQVSNGDGSLTVNGLHIRLLGGTGLGALGSGDIIISHTRCGPAGAPVPMASGAGLWLGLGLVGLVAVPVVITARRRRPGLSAA